MKRKFLIKAFVLIFVALVFLPSISFAQTNSLNSNEDQNSSNPAPTIDQIKALQTAMNKIEISMSASPELPKPGQLVTVTLSSPGSDLLTETISWYLNGKLVDSKRGLNKFSFTASSLGKTTLVSVTVTNDGGQAGEASLSLKSNEVVLIWEADSYVPPFYKGKALPPMNGIVRTIAIPEVIGPVGKKVSPNNLNFNWKLNGAYKKNDSGVGKDSFYYIDDQYVTNGNLVSVEVSTFDGSASAKDSTYIKQFAPKILFYSDNITLGRLNNLAINSFIYTSDTMTKISAEPYFFSYHRTSPNLQYSWQIDGTTVTLYGPVMDLSKLSSGPSLFSSITLNIKNSVNFLQGAGGSIGLKPETTNTETTSN